MWPIDVHVYHKISWMHFNSITPKFLLSWLRARPFSFSRSTKSLYILSFWVLSWTGSRKVSTHCEHMSTWKAFEGLGLTALILAYCFGFTRSFTNLPKSSVAFATFTDMSALSSLSLEGPASTCSSVYRSSVASDVLGSLRLTHKSSLLLAEWWLSTSIEFFCFVNRLQLYSAAPFYSCGCLLPAIMKISGHMVK